MTVHIVRRFRILLPAKEKRLISISFSLSLSLSTYVVLLNVRMIGLESIVQYGDHNSFASYALLPGGYHIHIESTTAILSTKD